jgi:hypothetical protein
LAYIESKENKYILRRLGVRNVINLRKFQIKSLILRTFRSLMKQIQSNIEESASTIDGEHEKTKHIN